MAILKPEKIKYLIVHCSATRPSQKIGAEEIDRWHKQKGWLGIGYHYVIRRDGTLETGRPIQELGAHVQNYNGVSLGICLVGGLNEETFQPENNFTPNQMMVLRFLLNFLKDYIENVVDNSVEILGHRDMPDVNKACPCFDVREWYAGDIGFANVK